MRWWGCTVLLQTALSEGAALEGLKEARGCPGARPGALVSSHRPAKVPHPVGTTMETTPGCLYPRPKGDRQCSQSHGASFPPSAPQHRERDFCFLSHFFSRPLPPQFQDGRSFSIPV